MAQATNFSLIFSRDKLGLRAQLGTGAVVAQSGKQDEGFYLLPRLPLSFSLRTYCAPTAAGCDVLKSRRYY